MREGIGSIFLYNMIIIFIVIVFAFLAGIMSYSKAFRINSKIINAIETFEGYNSKSDAEIKRALTNFGYRIGQGKCTDKYGDAINHITTGDFDYCIYELKIDDKHYNYGILTYMYIDVPIVGDNLRIPVYTKSDTIYYFTEK